MKLVIASLGSSRRLLIDVVTIGWVSFSGGAQPMPLASRPDQESVFRSTTQAESSQTGAWSITEAGPHHRRWTRVAAIQQVDGPLHSITNSYVELGTGMNVWSASDNQWIEASDEIEVLADHAVARKSQHQVIFSGNLRALNGTIDLLTADGHRLRSHVVGLVYAGSDTDESVFIAETKDSQGLVLGRNQVLYVDAFDAIKADIRYTTTRATFAQDVILRERIPPPEDYGLRSENTRLEVWTEFLEAPEPEQAVIHPNGRKGHEEFDQTLSFGTMQFGPGRAFSALVEAEENPIDKARESIGVSKQWEHIEGRTFLIESLPYVAAAAKLDALGPPTASRPMKTLPPESLVHGTQAPRRMPLSLTRSSPLSAPRGFQIARATAPVRRDGFVIDYEAITSQANLTFKGDTTYFVQSMVFLSGTTTFEGGAVIKYSKYTAPDYVYIAIYGPTECLTDAYRPLILTAMDDDTVGETISGSNGSPTGYYSLYGLGFRWGSDTLSNVRANYITIPYSFYDGTNYVLRNAQAVKCWWVIDTYGADAFVRNMLVNDAVWVYNGPPPGQPYASSARFEHLTVNKATYLTGNSACYITNSLLVEVANLGTYSGAYNELSSQGSAVFQSAAAGSHYLKSPSPYRNAGTTNLEPELLAELRQRTTSPPLLIVSNTIATPTTFQPSVQRDTDLPDLGYHYASLDYVFNRVTVTNTVLILTNGVAIGTYGHHGIDLQTGATFVSEGTPTRLNRLGHVNRVQEQATFVTDWLDYGWLHCCSSAQPQAVIHWAHSDLSFLAGPSYSRGLIWSVYIHVPRLLKITDSYLRGSFVHFAAYNTTNALLVDMRNNLSERSLWTYYQAGTNYMPFDVVQNNNTFLGGWCEYDFVATNSTWIVTDNFFGPDMVARDGGPILASNNGYKSGLMLLNGETSAKTGIVPDYQPGPMTNWLASLGRFYYPSTGSATSLTNLFNAGSRNATNAGLYHFTTLVNQTKETNSIVDIGFHYVALDGNGNPNDYDADGSSDYYEDADGDGGVDWGETAWQSGTDVGLKIRILQPKSNSNLP